MMQPSGRTRYSVEFEENGRRGEIEFEGPAGLSDAEIERLADQQLRQARPGQQFQPSQYGGEMQGPAQLQPPQEQIDPTPGWIDRFAQLPGPAGQAVGMMGTIANAAGGLAPHVAGFAQGAGGVMDNAAELLQGGYNQTLGRLFGQSDSATRANNEGGGFQGAADRLGEGSGVGRTLGELGASALLTRGMGGPVAQGAGAGALMSDADSAAGLLRDTAAGAAGGWLGDRLVRGISSAVAPAVQDSARYLWNRGVRMTPGQAIPRLRRTEDRLTSRPFVGDQIVRGRQQSYEDFNRVALDEVIAPYNSVARQPVRVPSNASGSGAIRSVGDQLSNRYERLVPQLRLIPDEQIAVDVDALRRTITNGDMSPEAVAQFETIVTNQVFSRLGGAFAPRSASRAVVPYAGPPPPRPLSGEAYRQIERSLGHQIRRFSRSDNPDHQAMARAFEELQTIFQSALQRSNPAHADELAALNSSWANLVRVEGAASGARGGLFSPLQFRAAVRRGDDSVRDRAMARGEARMQDLAEAGADVLPPEYPDSGTAGRSQMSPFDPRWYLGMGQGLLYGPSTQQAITNAFMYPRPASAQTIADLIRRLPAPQIGAAGATAITPSLFGPVP